jgi:hypothetical protein
MIEYDSESQVFPDGSPWCPIHHYSGPCRCWQDRRFTFFPIGSNVPDKTKPLDVALVRGVPVRAGDMTPLLLRSDV